MNLSIDDIKFKIFMEFEAIQKPLNFSTISINNIFMAKMLQNKQIFLKRCQDLALPTIIDLFPIDTPNEVVLKESENQGKPHAANVICKNGTPLLIQIWCCEKTVSGKIVYHKGIFEWIESFVKTTNLSGMLSFDFIVNKGDQAFCTGCTLKLNPAISIFTDESKSSKLEEVIR